MQTKTHVARGRSLSLHACLVVFLGVFAGGAWAGSQKITVEFDFLASELDMLGSTIVVPPDGTIDVASATIEFTGDGKGTIVPGPVRLTAFALGVTVDADAFEQQIDGTIDGELVSPASGQLDGAQVIDFSGDMVVSLQVDLTCAGPFCGEIADFPISIDDDVVFTELGSLTLTDIAAGPATASGVFDLDVGGLQSVLTLSGVESSRVVPEPAGGAWAAVAVFALARRRRARSAADSRRPGRGAQTSHWGYGG